MRTAVLCALLGLVCLASAQRSMGPASAPAPAPGMLNAKRVHRVMRLVPSVVLVCSRVQVLLP